MISVPLIASNLIWSLALVAGIIVNNSEALNIYMLSSHTHTHRTLSQNFNAPQKVNSLKIDYQLSTRTFTSFWHLTLNSVYSKVYIELF